MKIWKPGTKIKQSKQHIYPLFGPEHEMSISCWCRPQALPQDARVILHRVLN